MTKRAIPQVPTSPDTQVTQFNRSVKENLEIIMGQRGEPLQELPDSATLANIIASVNSIIRRLQ